MANVTIPTNSTDVSELVLYVNTQSNGQFGTWVLLVIFCIAFFTLKKYPTSQAFSAAAFITTVMGFLFFAVGIVPTWIMFVSTILTCAGIVWLYFDVI